MTHGAKTDPWRYTDLSFAPGIGGNYAVRGAPGMGVARPRMRGASGCGSNHREARHQTPAERLARITVLRKGSGTGTGRHRITTVLEIFLPGGGCRASRIENIARSRGSGLWRGAAGLAVGDSPVLWIQKPGFQGLCRSPIGVCGRDEIEQALCEAELAGCGKVAGTHASSFFAESGSFECLGVAAALRCGFLLELGLPGC